MSTDPTVCILLTTYKRTWCALETIKALKENFQWPQICWFISDDGSEPGHVEQLKAEIGPSYNIYFYNSGRKGVGHGMNHSLRRIFKEIAPLVLVMEDDWKLNRPVDMRPYVNTLMNYPENGLIRYGYISTNILGYTISHEGRMFWRIESNKETYRFTGHPSLRHSRFHEHYGWYDEGRAAGETELSMCGKVNARDEGGPHILYPCDCGTYGFFDHIGAESLADISPV